MWERENETKWVESQGNRKMMRLGPNFSKCQSAGQFARWVGRWTDQLSSEEDNMSTDVPFSVPPTHITWDSHWNDQNTRNVDIGSVQDHWSYGRVPFTFRKARGLFTCKKMKEGSKANRQWFCLRSSTLKWKRLPLLDLGDEGKRESVLRADMEHTMCTPSIVQSRSLCKRHWEVPRFEWQQPPTESLQGSGVCPGRVGNDPWKAVGSSCGFYLEWRPDLTGKWKWKIASPNTEPESQTRSPLLGLLTALPSFSLWMDCVNYYQPPLQLKIWQQDLGSNPKKCDRSSEQFLHWLYWLALLLCPQQEAGEPSLDQKGLQNKAPQSKCRWKIYFYQIFSTGNIKFLCVLR